MVPWCATDKHGQTPPVSSLQKIPSKPLKEGMQGHLCGLHRKHAYIWRLKPVYNVGQHLRNMSPSLVFRTISLSIKVYVADPSPYTMLYSSDGASVSRTGATPCPKSSGCGVTNQLHSLTSSSYYVDGMGSWKDHDIRSFQTGGEPTALASEHSADPTGRIDASKRVTTRVPNGETHAKWQEVLQFRTAAGFLQFIPLMLAEPGRKTTTAMKGGAKCVRSMEPSLIPKPNASHFHWSPNLIDLIAHLNRLIPSHRGDTAVSFS